MKKKGKKRGRKNRTPDPTRKVQVPLLQSPTPTSLPPPILLVDCNNVRGVNDFYHTLAEFLSGLLVWAQVADMAGRLVVVIDHARTADAINMGGIIIAFAGAGRTADDIIVEDARYFDRLGARVAVITNDRGLRRRLAKNLSANGQRTAPTGRVKCFGSDSLLATIQCMLEISSLGIHDTLQILQIAEKKMRSSYAMNSFSEATWHRILAAELCRRCMRVVGDVNNAGDDNGGAHTISATEVSQIPLLDSDLALHLLCPFDKSHSFSWISYFNTHRRPVDMSRGILWDHRIRHDKAQKNALGQFLLCQFSQYFRQIEGNSTGYNLEDRIDFDRTTFPLRIDFHRSEDGINGAAEVWMQLFQLKDQAKSTDAANSRLADAV